MKKIFISAVLCSCLFACKNNESGSGWLLNNFNAGNYIGLPLLIWMGMTKKQEEPDGFPQMIKWLRE